MGWFSWLRRRQKTATKDAATQFTWQSGRRYMVGDSYILPRDLTEANRIDFQHFLLRTAMHGNYATPLQNPRSILDVGCGNGRWAMEMAELFPQARVVGLDVNIPPEESGAAPHALVRPPNYTFTQGNVLTGLPFAEGEFDFTHQRLLYGSIPAQKWPEVARELARVTSQGGWVELVESALMDADGPAGKLFNKWLVETTGRRGTDLRLGAEVERFLREAGLRHIEAYSFVMPIGRHGGRLGGMMEANTLAFVGGFRGLVTGAGIASEEDYDQMMAPLREEIAQRNYTISYYLSYGQRG